MAGAPCYHMPAHSVVPTHRQSGFLSDCTSANCLFITVFWNYNVHFETTLMSIIHTI